MRPKTKLLRITDDSVVVETEEGQESIRADTVVMGVGAQSVNQLAEVVKPIKTEVITIGDAKEPRKITEAVREGFEEALKI